MNKHHSHLKSTYPPSMASSFLDLIFISSFLMLVSSSLAKTSPRPFLQVTKDPKTHQYITQISQRTPLIPLKLTLDLGGEFMWVNCEQDYTSSTFTHPICDSPPCHLLNTTSCITECLGQPSVDCANNTCGSFPSNPIANTGTGGNVVGDVFAVKSTDGKNLLPPVTLRQLYFVCGSNFINEGLATGVTGMAGLGRTQMSLPAQLSSYFKFHQRFALCLSSSNGAVFFGDASSFLEYTPLIINSISGGQFVGDASPQYYIGVKSIKVGGNRVKFNESLLLLNEGGYGGTIISTVQPYTVLETSIYGALVAAFVKAMPQNVKRVKNVAPFGACFSSKKIKSSRLGPVVPSIDLVLQSKNVWRINGGNSMVKVKKDVLCLGFVEERSEFTPMIPVVIGGFQIEDNLLQFDLEKSRLGFSSSLIGRSINCANFNFTSIA